MLNVFDALPERVLDKIAFEPNTGCWLWTAARFAQTGYGQLSVSQNGCVKAHRYVYARLVAPIAPGLHLHHACHVKHCVNPAHLTPLTPKAHAHTELIRDNNRWAKLTSAQVVTIRQRYRAGGISQAKLAREYGVSDAAIYDLLRGKTWRELTGPPGGYVAGRGRPAPGQPGELF